jgi:hypothetical protein
VRACTAGAIVAHAHAPRRKPSSDSAPPRRVAAMACSEPRARERERHRVAPGLGPTPVFHSCIPTGMRGPARIVWADLTPSSPRSDMGKSAGSAVKGMGSMLGRKSGMSALASKAGLMKEEDGPGPPARGLRVPHSTSVLCGGLVRARRFCMAQRPKRRSPASVTVTHRALGWSAG